jgi:hypothetical protein
VLHVGWSGPTRFKGRRVRTATALRRLPIGNRAKGVANGLHDVYLFHQKFMQIDLRQTAAQT